MVAEFVKTLCFPALALNLILAGILGYGFYRVRENRNQIQFSARHYQPMQTVLILSLIYIGVESNLQLFGSVGKFFDMGITLRWTLKTFFALSFLSLYALRCWLPHFDYHTGVAMFTRVTNIKLKPEEVEAFEWFVTNKAQYGSPKYMNRFLAILSCAFTVVFLVWTLISPATFYIGMAVIFIILGLVAMDVVKKITVLDDELFIRRELLRDWKIIAVFYFIVGFFTMLGPVIGWAMTGWILNEFSVGFVFVLGYNSTFWLLDRSDVFTVPILMDQIAIAKTGESETQKFCVEHSLPSFEEMMEDPVAVATFLKHLVWELSVENLFFLSDVMRYKRTFLAEKMIQSMPGFYYDVPHMLSRYGYRRDRGIIPYAWSISHAYVDNLSAFYITAMDEDERDRILEFLENLSPDQKLEGKQLEDLVCIFDTAARHVFALIKQAHGRFVRNAKLNLKSLRGNGVNSAAAAGGGGPMSTTAGLATSDTRGQMATHMSMS